MIIKPAKQQDFPHLYDLLLLADPSIEQIKLYLEKGICYVGSIDHVVIGVYVLVFKTPYLSEVANLAVSPNHQGKGYGKTLLQDAIKTAHSYGASAIKICTGNSSLDQLALYQKCGFRMQHIDRDYFVVNYSEPIFENGIQCMDRICLEKKLHQKGTKHSQA